MKQINIFLLALVALLMGALPGRAQDQNTIHLTVEVDDASHLQMWRGYSWEQLPETLSTGTNSIEMDNVYSYVTFTPDEGYKISEISKNDEDLYDPNMGRGEYTVHGVADGDVIRIKTIRSTICYLDLKNVRSMKVWNGLRANGNEITDLREVYSQLEILGDNPTLSFTPNDGSCLSYLKVGGQWQSVDEANSGGECVVDITEGLLIESRADAVLHYTVNVDNASSVKLLQLWRGSESEGKEIQLNDGDNNLTIPEFSRLLLAADEDHWINSVTLNGVDPGLYDRNRRCNFNWEEIKEGDAIVISATLSTFDFPVTVDNPSAVKFWRGEYQTWLEGTELPYENGTIKISRDDPSFTVMPAEGYWLKKGTRNNEVNYENTDTYSGDNRYYWSDVRDDDKIEILTDRNTMDVAVEIGDMSHVQFWSGHRYSDFPSESELPKSEDGKSVEVSRTDRYITISAVDGYWIDSVKRNGEDVSAYTSNKVYHLSDIAENDTITIQSGSNMLDCVVKVENPSFIRMWKEDSEVEGNEIILVDKTPVEPEQPEEEQQGDQPLDDVQPGEDQPAVDETDGSLKLLNLALPKSNPKLILSADNDHWIRSVRIFSTRQDSVVVDTLDISDHRNVDFQNIADGDIIVIEARTKMFESPVVIKGPGVAAGSLQFFGPRKASWSEEREELTLSAEGKITLDRDDPSLEIRSIEEIWIDSIAYGKNSIVGGPTRYDISGIADIDTIVINTSRWTYDCKIEIDNPSHVQFWQGWHNFGDEGTPLTVAADGKSVPVRKNYRSMTITVADGYRIESVKRNGIEVSAYSANKMYHLSGLEYDDVITITTSSATFDCVVDANDISHVRFWKGYRYETSPSGDELVKAADGKSVSVHKDDPNLTITCADGFWIDSVKLNGEEVSAYTTNKVYQLSDISTTDTISISTSLNTLSLQVNVDKKGSVKLWQGWYNSNYDDGTELTLTDDGTIAVIKDDPSITVTAADGYEIYSVMKNDEPIGEYNPNEYHISSIQENDIVNVVTSRLVNFTIDINDINNVNVSRVGDSQDVWYNVGLENGENSISLSERYASLRVITNDSRYRIHELSVNNVAVAASVDKPGEYLIPSVAEGDLIKITALYVPYEPSIDYNGRYVSLINNEGNAEVRYTLDGSDPKDGTVYSDRFDVGGLCTLKVVTVKDGTLYSDIVEYPIKAYSDGSTASVSEPGKLYEALSYLNNYGVDDEGRLKVVGPINGDDINNVKGLSGLQYLDLEDAIIDKLPSNAFSYNNNLRSISLPKTLESYGVGAFEQCWRLRALIWNSPNVTITRELRRSLQSDNLLIYLQNNTTCTFEDETDNKENIIINGVASSVKLRNGSEFVAPLPFTATNISFTRNFNKTTAIDGCAGWETMVLPFEVQEVTYNGRQLSPFGSDASSMHFWLFEPSAEGWQSAVKMEANKPYLISMPNNELYDYDYNVNGDVTFSGTNVAVVATTDPREGADYKDGAQMWTTYINNLDSYEDMWTLNNSETYEGDPAGSVFVKGQRNADPFECYLTSPSGAAKMPVFDSSEVETLFAENACRVWCENGELLIASTVSRRVQIVDLTGSVVRVVDVTAGETCRVRDLAPGLYMAANRKIIVK